MSSFKIIKSNEYNDWIKNSPIKILKTQVIESADLKERFLQVKFKNLTRYDIKSVYASIKCFDDTRELVNSMENVDFLNVNAKGLEIFGGESPIKLENNSTYYVEITIKKVSYGEDLVWKNSNSKKVQIEYGKRIDYKGDLLEQLKIEMGDFKNSAIYFPNRFKEYWTCSCGEYNDINKNYCGNCGISLEFLDKCFDKKALEIKMKDRLEKERIEKEEKEFLAEERRIEQEKYSKRFLVVFWSVVVILIVLFLIVIIFKGSSDRKYIKSFCSSGSGKVKNSLSEVLDDYSCGSMALYLRDNEFTREDAQLIMDRGNKDIYDDFYNIQNKELYEYLDEEKYENMIIYTYGESYSSNDKEYLVVPYEYLEHLYEENPTYKAPEYLYQNFLSEAFYNENYDKWKKVVSYLNKYGYSWGSSMDYVFTSGYIYDYDGRINRVRANLEYAKYYYDNSGDYYCSLHSFSNEEYVRKNLETVSEGTGQCAFVMGTVMDDLTADEIQTYINAGGDIMYTDYIGNYINELVFRSYANTADPQEYEAKLKLLVNNGVDINRIHLSGESDPGKTALDQYIFRTTFFTEKEKVLYNILKKYGARCNIECSREKYFK